MASEVTLAKDEDATLRRHFRRGMLTDQAARLIQQAVSDLIGHPGWNEDRVKDWIEKEKSAISGRNRLDEVSILADALNWAVRNPNPDPLDPKGFYSWPESSHDPKFSDQLQFQINGTFPHALPTTTSPYYSPLNVHDKDGAPTSGGPPYGDIGIYGDMTRSPDPNSPLYSSTAKYQDPHHLDPSAQILLDNLASFGRTSVQAGHPVHDVGALEHGAIGSNHFAGLLEAVTTAAGQEASQNRSGQTLDAPSGQSPGRQPLHQPAANEYRTLKEDSFSKSKKRKRSSAADQNAIHSDAEGEQERLDAFEPPPFLTTRRGRRSSKFGGPSENSRFEQDAGETNTESEDYSTLEFRELPPQLVISDARAAGVHSAAALFRRPSASSKKYTRPPMSKLFTSLELSPENFLQLQAAAKLYMLDPDHPERQNCVGNRGKGDTDMVKLRLYNCVKDFLEAEGHGERYFGEQATNESGVPRRLIWPAQKNKIIGLVTPLLRRMVTNERQRQYAVETRKGDSEAKKRKADEMQSVSTSTEQSEAPRDRLTHEASVAPSLDCFGEYPDHNKDPAIAQQISNLGLLSGLTNASWTHLVSEVDADIRNHESRTSSGGVECDGACLESSIWERYLLQPDHPLISGWRRDVRLGKDDRVNLAHLILQDLCNAIKLSIMLEKEEVDIRCHSKRQKTSSATFTTSAHLQYHGQVLHRLEHPETIDQTLERLISGSCSELLERSNSFTSTQLNIYFLHGGRKVRPQLELSSGQYYAWKSLSKVIEDEVAALKDGQDVDHQVHAHLPQGLLPIRGQAELVLAIMDSIHTSWMDSQLKIIVEIR